MNEVHLDTGTRAVCLTLRVPSGPNALTALSGQVARVGALRAVPEPALLDAVSRTRGE